MKSLTKLGIAGLVLVILAFFWLGLIWTIFIEAPLVHPSESPVRFIYPQGASVKYVAGMLKQQNLIRHPSLFVLLVRLNHDERNLKAGEYQVEPGMTVVQLLKKMVKGDVIRHEFTIVEGWNFQQVLDALAGNKYIKHLAVGLKPVEIMAKINHEGEFPEGRFAPDTYLFSGDVSDLDLLYSAYRLMHNRLDFAWAHKAQDAPYHCPYEALIVASIIEKETATEAEKPVIAGVILRRLAKEMLLQLDPTVIYGLGPYFGGKLTIANLRQDTPYNTYLRKGLPPTPISMPSKSSIEASLHPAAGTVLYYVAKGDGTHEFSNTLQEQERAIRKYLFKRKD